MKKLMDCEVLFAVKGFHSVSKKTLRETLGLSKNDPVPENIVLARKINAEINGRLNKRLSCVGYRRSFGFDPFGQIAHLVEMLCADEAVAFWRELRCWFSMYTDASRHYAREAPEFLEYRCTLAGFIVDRYTANKSGDELKQFTSRGRDFVRCVDSIMLEGLMSRTPAESPFPSRKEVLEDLYQSSWGVGAFSGEPIDPDAPDWW